MHALPLIRAGIVAAGTVAAGIVAVGIATGGAAWSNSPATGAAAAPPARVGPAQVGPAQVGPAQVGQARIGYVCAMAGPVELRIAGAWIKAAPHLPAASGSALRSAAGGSATLCFGGDRIALAAQSEIDVAALDPAAIKISLVAGTAAFGIGRSDETVAVALAGRSVSLAPGHYELAAASGPSPARVIAYAGSAQVTAGERATAVLAGQQALLDPAGATPGAAPMADATAAAVALPSVAPPPNPFIATMPGYAALAGAGSWAGAGDLGPVWFPAVAADWAPYRDGRWLWAPPWGWTWVDAAAWGFAPSHYGRWQRIFGRWGWLPGKLTAPPLYAPALVAFVGTPAVGLSIADSSQPAIAWFPLAANEVYWPGYSRDLAYIRRLNAGSVADPAAIRFDRGGAPADANVDGAYANREFASAVPRPVFTGGGAVAAALVDVPKRRLREAPVILGALAITPPAPHPAALPPTLRVVPAVVRPVVLVRRTSRPPPRLRSAILRRISAPVVRAVLRGPPRLRRGGHLRVPAFAAPGPHHARRRAVIHRAATHGPAKHRAAKHGTANLRTANHRLVKHSTARLHHRVPATRHAAHAPRHRPPVRTIRR